MREIITIILNLNLIAVLSILTLTSIIKTINSSTLLLNILKIKDKKISLKRNRFQNLFKQKMKLLNQKNEIPTNKNQNYSNFNLTTTLILKSKKRFKSL